MRKSKLVRITAEGRDKGKAYLLTEWPATRAEKWGLKVIFALENSGFNIPEEMKGAGMGALAGAGAERLLSGRMRFEEFEPLLDEMWECVQFVPEPSKPGNTRPLMIEAADDVEELPTILELRKEVLKLHLDFLPAAVRSRIPFLSDETTETAASSSTRTSQPSSESSSHRGKHRPSNSTPR